MDVLTKDDFLDVYRDIVWHIDDLKVYFSDDVLVDDLNAIKTYVQHLVALCLNKYGIACDYFEEPVR